jgi:hypothetical protein
VRTRARRAAVLVALLSMAGCAATPEGAAPIPPSAREWTSIALRNPGFEDEPNPGRACPMGWDCTMHADPNSFRFFHDDAAPARGKRSLCMEPVNKEPLGVASQGLFDMARIRGGRVRFSVEVRLDAVTGSGAGPFVVAQGGGGAAVAHATRLRSGTQGWQRVEVEMDVPANAALIEFGVTLEGRGRVCLDDARLEVLGPPKTPV